MANECNLTGETIKTEQGVNPPKVGLIAAGEVCLEG